MNYVTTLRRVGVLGVMGALGLGCSSGGIEQVGTAPVAPVAAPAPAPVVAPPPVVPAAPAAPTPAPVAAPAPAPAMPAPMAVAPAANTPAPMVPAMPEAMMPATPAMEEKPAEPELEKFSFFVTSYAAIQRLSGSRNGFGGDLRFGQPTGLEGADKICTDIAEFSMPGASKKVWRAFLSVTKGPDGQPLHAIDRVGQGPWYDREGRTVALNKEVLLNPRPGGADPVISNDLPNEDGIPNHAPDGQLVDNHDILTGTNNRGRAYSTDPYYTCNDWTSAVGRDGMPRVGHSWPRQEGGNRGGQAPRQGQQQGTTAGGAAGAVAAPPPTGPEQQGDRTGDPLEDYDTVNWMSSLNEAGCAPGASLVEMGPPNMDNPTVGSGGGYGGIYCFALKP